MTVASVVKVGGSLRADPARLARVLGALADGANGPCLVVPGGGSFADAVRRAQTRRGFDDARAHRLALDAMGRTAAHFRAVEPRLTPCADLPDAVRGAASVRTPRASAATVWDPAALRAGHPDIPETWDVTSDSLALWLAARVGAARCILVKSADAPPGMDVAGLARLGLVDRAFPGFSAGYRGEILIQGPGGTAPVRAREAA